MDAASIFQGGVGATSSSPMGSHHVEGPLIPIGEIDQSIRGLAPAPLQTLGTEIAAKRKPLFGRRGAAKELEGGSSNIQTGRKTGDIATAVLSETQRSPQIRLSRLFDQQNVRNGDTEVAVSSVLRRTEVDGEVAPDIVTSGPGLVIEGGAEANHPATNAVALLNSNERRAFIREILILSSGNLNYADTLKRSEGLQVVLANGCVCSLSEENLREAVAIDNNKAKTRIIKGGQSQAEQERLTTEAQEKGFRVMVVSGKDWNYCISILKEVVNLINREKQKEQGKGAAEVQVVGHVETATMDKRTGKEINEGARRVSFSQSKNLKDIDEEKKELKEMLKKAREKAVIEKTNNEIQEAKQEDFSVRLKKKILSKEIDKEEIDKIDTRQDKDVIS